MMQLNLIAVCLFGVAFHDGAAVYTPPAYAEPKDVVSYPDGRKVNAALVMRSLVVPSAVNESIPVLDGCGYSSDLRQLTSSRCFKVRIAGKSEEQSVSKFGEATSFSNLQNEFGVDVIAGAFFGLFSADARAIYLRSIQDDDYSLSLNYYQYSAQEVDIQVAGYGTSALNDFGYNAYSSGNSRFGLTCGDHYVSSYKEGALLAMALVIKFNSAVDKTVFTAAGGGFLIFPFLSALGKIKATATSKQISGQVAVQAFQMGGEPSQLSKILGPNAESPFYLMSCSMTALDDCQKAVEDLLHYARDNFPTQYSFKNSTGLTSLGAAFSTYTTIKDIGLSPPTSLVTDEVLKYRRKLAERVKECESIIRKLDVISNSKTFDAKHENILENVNEIRSRAEANCRLLKGVKGEAAACFTDPEDCISKTKPYLESQLYNFTAIDIMFLENDKSIVEYLESKNLTETLRQEKLEQIYHRLDDSS